MQNNRPARSAGQQWVIGLGNGVISAKALSEPMLTDCQLLAIHRSEVQFNRNQNTHILHVMEICFKMATAKIVSILFRPRCVGVEATQ